MCVRSCVRVFAGQGRGAIQEREKAEDDDDGVRKVLDIFQGGEEEIRRWREYEGRIL